MRAFALLLLAALAAPISAGADKPIPDPPGSIQCNDGKLKKQIAGTKWKMHGCSDGHSLLFMLDENNPDKLTYLSLRYRETGYEIIGGGLVSRPEAKAAVAWISALTVPEIEARTDS